MWLSEVAHEPGRPATRCPRFSSSPRLERRLGPTPASGLERSPPTSLIESLPAMRAMHGTRQPRPRTESRQQRQSKVTSSAWAFSEAAQLGRTSGCVRRTQNGVHKTAHTGNGQLSVWWSPKYCWEVSVTSPNGVGRAARLPAWQPTKSGNPCHMPPLSGTSWCWAHADDDRVQRQRACPALRTA